MSIIRILPKPSKINLGTIPNSSNTILAIATGF